jgi:hypothetical protein
MVYGPDYFKQINDAVLVLGMVETPGAIRNLDQILEIETMDGIYVGPNDLGIAMGMAAGTDREEPEFLRVLEDIARRANAHGYSRGRDGFRPCHAMRRYGTDPRRRNRVCENPARERRQPTPMIMAPRIARRLKGRC